MSQHTYIDDYGHTIEIEAASTSDAERILRSRINDDWPGSDREDWSRAYPEVVRVNIYRSAGEWCYRADDEEGFDHSDTLDVGASAEWPEARRYAERRYPNARIVRVDALV